VAVGLEERQLAYNVLDVGEWVHLVLSGKSAESYPVFDLYKRCKNALG
jgi:hypothetical protein